MYLLYSLLLLVWGIVLIPAFVCKARRRKKSLPGFAQRIGRLPDRVRHDGRATIWFHSCSVGETLSLQPLVRNLRDRLPDARFVFSTVTETGQQVAIKQFAAYGPGNTFYFPIDLARIVRKVLEHIRPALIVIIDTEIWPNTVHEAHRRGIPVLLVNGRISASSFRFSRLARPVLRSVFDNYSALLMQSSEDADRIRRMGASPDKVRVIGNIKFDAVAADPESEKALLGALDEAFGFSRTQAPLIVAGSTHPGEEQTLLAVLRRIRGTPGLQDTRLLLAPRHPERFAEAAGIAARHGFGIRRRTDGAGAGPEAEVLLLDTIGELAAAYRFATVAFVGGSLVPHGGHSILEPARHSKPIVIGPSMENFRSIAGEFLAHGGVRQIRAGAKDPGRQEQQLLDVFLQLLQNSEERDAAGRAAGSILEQNRGATHRACERIEAVFEEARRR